MTLQPYQPDELDVLALRLFDLTATLRRMAKRCRDEKIKRFDLHDRKLLEMLGKIEEWAHDAEARLEMEIIRQHGAQRAKR